MPYRIHRTSRKEPPCKKAVLRYGEWESHSARVPPLYRFGHDSDINRGERIEGDRVVWESRSRWWEVEATLDEIVDECGAIVYDGEAVEIYDTWRE